MALEKKVFPLNNKCWDNCCRTVPKGNIFQRKNWSFWSFVTFVRVPITKLSGQKRKKPLIYSDSCLLNLKVIK